QWQQTNGPLGGPISSIAADNGNLYAGSYGGGVFVSLDNGDHWTLRNTGLGNLFVHVLAVSGSTVLAGTFGGGIYKSSNSAASWGAVNQGITDSYISAVMINGSEYFAGSTTGEIYRSTNSGASWTPIDTIAGIPPIYQFYIDGVRIFVATGSGLYLLSKHNETWTAELYGLSSWEITSFTVNNGNLYAGGFSPTQKMGGVLVYKAGGVDWYSANQGNYTGLNDYHVTSFLLINNVLTAGTRTSGVFQTVNFTPPWTNQSTNLSNLHVNCLASNGSYMYAGTDDGVYRWSESGGSWTRKNTGLISAKTNALLVSKPGRINAATDGAGMFWSTNQGATWYAHGGITDEENYLTALAYDSTYYYQGTSTGVYRFSASGTGSSSFRGGGTFVRALHVNGKNIFAATAEGVFLSTNKATDWVPFNTGLGNYYGSVSCFAQNGNYLFAGTFGYGVYLSTNNGTSWSAVNTGFKTSNGAWVSALLCTGTSVFVALTNKEGIYRTTNNGTTWIPVSTGLTDRTVYTLATDGTNLYAGTAGGAFFSSDNGNSWQFSGLAGISVKALVVDGSSLYAGTNSLGVWRLAISGSTSASEDVTNRPEQFQLSQNYPNPFNPSTLIEYELAHSGNVLITVHDVLGREVATLVNEFKTAGTHRVTFTAAHASATAQPMSSGMYFYRIRTDGSVQTRKMIFQK
ncbi:MAG TPA: T9SS type A sorting domain-containing protein, partial [Bacteroidota bacterium]|nr:T9SS type A sorting domain-containing protein [Bacteroidota bacterium]